MRLSFLTKHSRYFIISTGYPTFQVDYYLCDVFFGHNLDFDVAERIIVECRISVAERYLNRATKVLLSIEFNYVDRKSVV